MDKLEILESCKLQILEKKEQIEISMNEANDSLFNETKSSAGDKYETSREMIQQDLSRLQKQMLQIDQELLTINNLVEDAKNHNIEGEMVVKRGSIVQTKDHYYFLSVGLGQVKWKEYTLFAISLTSPLANHLYGKKVGDQIEFNKKTQTLQNIY